MKDAVNAIWKKDADMTKSMETEKGYPALTRIQKTTLKPASWVNINDLNDAGS